MAAQCTIGARDLLVFIFNGYSFPALRLPQPVTPSMPTQMPSVLAPGGENLPSCVPFKGGKPGFRVHSTAYVLGNRNTSTFLHVLAAYKANTGMDLNRLLECAESFQAGQSAPPLARAENVGIVASILRNAVRYSQGNPNRERLGLVPREGFLPLDEFRAWKAERQAAGCEYARGVRTEDRRTRIANAVRMIEAVGDQVSVSLVARMVRVSRDTARKYLSDGVLNSCIKNRHLEDVSHMPKVLK